MKARCTPLGWYRPLSHPQHMFRLADLRMVSSREFSNTRADHMGHAIGLSGEHVSLELKFHGPDSETLRDEELDRLDNALGQLEGQVGQ